MYLKSSSQPMVKLHVEVPSELHQKLRVKVAYLNADMTSLIVRLLELETKDVVIPAKYQSTR